MASPESNIKVDAYSSVAANGPTVDSSELFPRTDEAFDSSPNSEKLRSAVPPADHGRAAWLFLAGCFLVEGLVWSLPFSFGVFEHYYSTHLPFSENPRNLAAVGTTASGLICFVSPFAVIILQRWPHSRLSITIIGFALIIIGLIAASFTNRVDQLIATQGAIYGIGGALLYNPFIFYLDEWFIARKGLAFGIMWAGTGLGGTVVPLIMDWSLGKYGFRTTLRMWAITFFILIGPLIYLIKPRLPLPPKGTPRPLNLGFFRTGVFWLLQTGNLIEGMGFYMPSIYLPVFASTYLNLSSLPSTLLVSLLNFSAILGTVLLGSLTDHLHPTTVISISALGSAIAVFFLWGFGISTPVIFIFALVYGVFAGGYTATWTGCVSEIQRDAREADAAVVIGMIAAGRGLGAVTSGPVSESLLGYRLQDMAGAYNTEYGVLIIFTGITAVLGGLGSLARLRLRGRVGMESTLDIRKTHEHTR